MMSQDMEEVLDILNKYSANWVYSDEESYIWDLEKVINCYQDLKDANTKKNNKLIPAILDAFEYAIENKKVVFIDF